MLLKPFRHLLLLFWAAALSACTFPLTGASPDVKYSEHFPERVRHMKANDYFEPGPQRKLAAAVERGNRKAIGSAIADGANVNHVGHNGMTPLYWGMGKQNLEGVKALLEHDADPDLRTDMPPDWRPPWENAMGFAVRMEDIRYLNALLDAGGDPNALIDDGNGSLLFRAVLHRRTDNIRLLIERGADVNHQAQFGGTALERAVGQGKYDIALMLLAIGADPKLGEVLESVAYWRKNRKNTYPDPLYEEFITALKKQGHFPPDF